MYMVIILLVFLISPFGLYSQKQDKIAFGQVIVNQNGGFMDIIPNHSKIKSLPILQDSSAQNSGYVAIYTKMATKGIYMVGNGIWIVGFLHVPGNYWRKSDPIFVPTGFNYGDNISQDKHLYAKAKILLPWIEQEEKKGVQQPIVWFGGDTLLFYKAFENKMPFVEPLPEKKDGHHYYSPYPSKKPKVTPIDKDQHNNSIELNLQQLKKIIYEMKEKFLSIYKNTTLVNYEKLKKLEFLKDNAKFLHEQLDELIADDQIDPMVLTVYGIDHLGIEVEELSKNISAKYQQIAKYQPIWNNLSIGNKFNQYQHKTLYLKNDERHALEAAISNLKNKMKTTK